MIEGEEESVADDQEEMRITAQPPKKKIRSAAEILRDASEKKRGLMLDQILKERKVSEY